MTTTRETPRTDALVEGVPMTGTNHTYLDMRSPNALRERLVQTAGMLEYRHRQAAALERFAGELERESAAKDATIAELREALQKLVDLAPDLKVAALLVSIAGAVMDDARAALAKVQP